MEINKGRAKNDDTFICKYKVATPPQQFHLALTLNAPIPENADGEPTTQRRFRWRWPAQAEELQPPRWPNTPLPIRLWGTASEEQRNSPPYSPRRKSRKVTPPTVLPLPAWGCGTCSDSCSGRLEDVQGKNVLSWYHQRLMQVDDHGDGKRTPQPRAGA